VSIEDTILKQCDEKYALSLLQRLIEIPSSFPQYEEIASFVKEDCLFEPGRTGEAHAINEHINVKGLYSSEKILALSTSYSRGLH